MIEIERYFFTDTLQKELFAKQTGMQVPEWASHAIIFYYERKQKVTSIPSYMLDKPLYKTVATYSDPFFFKSGFSRGFIKKHLKIFKKLIPLSSE